MHSFIESQVRKSRLAIAVLACAVCSLNALIAQESIVESSNGNSYLTKNTIIRNLSQMQNIVYKTDGNEHYFCLVDSFTTVEAKMPLSGCEINDFEILDSHYVFFCGNDGTGYGLVGYFDLLDVFSSTAPTVYYSPTNMQFNSNYIITNLKRLEVYSGTGYVHVVMVGDCFGEHQKNYCVADMYAPGIPTSGQWLLQIMVHEKIVERFDDIAVGKTYVATSGVLAGSNGANSIRFYDKPVSYSTHLFSTSLCQTINYSNYKPLYPVAIEHCEQDYFVTASVFEKSGPQTILTSYNGTSIHYQYSIKSDPDTPVSIVKDIAYHPAMQSLYFLQDFQTLNSVESYILDINPMYYVISFINYVIPSGIDVMNSLDANAFLFSNAESSGVKATGESMIYHRDITSTNPCSSISIYHIDREDYPLRRYDFDYESWDKDILMDPYNITVSTYTNTIECD